MVTAQVPVRPTQRSRARTAIDLALALVAFGTSLALYAHGLGSSGSVRHLDALGVVLAAAQSLPLVAWRRAPIAVFVTAGLVSAVAMLIGYPGGPPVAATVALYLVARSRDGAGAWNPRLIALVAGVLMLHLICFGIGHGTVPLLQLVFGVLVWAVALFAGDRSRLRRAELSELEQRAIRAERDAQRERQLAAAEERTRIARDLHDSAGHALNVIAVHAGAARLLQERDPRGALSAIETVEAVARQTVGEIDQIVHRLRGGRERAEAPTGLAALDSLVAQHESAGRRVTIRRAGVPRRLGVSLDQAAYRILQEALTNAARHGGGGAEVELSFGTGELELTVTNPVDGSTSARARGGHGLVGMRERATMVGGRLEAEPSDGVFRVHATLPYRGR